MANFVTMREKVLAVMGLTVCAALLVSAVDPYERSTWWMEVAPVLIAGPLLVATYRRFPLTSLVYSLIFLQALILIVGGAYTYARVPFGFELENWFHLLRNPYDKIGHFAQGVVPALLAREILLRGHYVCGRRMVLFLSVCVAMAVSAWYELIEWGAALVLGQGANEFLGTQGDPLDTQSDMFIAFIGAVLALALLVRIQDRQMVRLERSLQPYKSTAVKGHGHRC